MLNRKAQFPSPRISRNFAGFLVRKNNFSVEKLSPHVSVEMSKNFN